MKVEEAIRFRKSARCYSDKKVSYETLAKIIKYATCAPSSGNVQNWRLIIVSKDEKKKELADAALHQQWITKAPILIVVCNELKDIRKMYGERGEKLYSFQNCAALTQNILLMAHSLGLGTCWVGAFNENAVKRVLKIPDDVVPVTIIPLGYAEKEEKAESKRMDLDLITFFEEWGKKEKEGKLPLKK